MQNLRRFSALRIVTPAKTAWELHRAYSGSRLAIIPDAGHASDESGIAAAIKHFADEFAKKL